MIPSNRTATHPGVILINTAALDTLNTALIATPPEPLIPTQGVRKDNPVNFAKGETLHGWEVPFNLPDDWPEDAKQPFEAFHTARQAMQRCVDQSIADHADQETLYGKPRIDKSKLRICGLFSVETVPAPTILSLDETLPAAEADSTVARSGEIESGDARQIAMWSLDVDYDQRSLMPHQVFFPMADARGGWNRLKKTIRAELDEDRLEQFHGTVSLPFEAGDNRRVAVKIVDDRGIESLKIVPLED